MRLVQVKEEERLLPVVLRNPVFRDRDRLGARPLHLADRHLGSGRRRQSGVVIVEAASEPRVLPQDVGRDGSARRVPRAPQPLGQRADPVVEREPDVVASAVLERQPSGEERCVGRQRLRAV